MTWRFQSRLANLPLFVLCGILVHDVVAGEREAEGQGKRLSDNAVRLKDITLADQYEKLHTYHFPLKQPMVLLVADRKGYEALTPWVEALRHPAGRDAAIVGIADVRGVPGFLRGKVRRKFQADQTYSILLDWDGDILNRLKPEKAIPNVFLISSEGKVLLQLSGEATAERLQRLRSHLAARECGVSLPVGPARRDGFLKKADFHQSISRLPSRRNASSLTFRTLSGGRSLAGSPGFFSDQTPIRLVERRGVPACLESVAIQCNDFNDSPRT